MPKENLFSKYPHRVRASTEQTEVWYVRLSGYYAVHGPVPASGAGSVVVLLDGGRIAVCRGKPGRRRKGSESVRVSPVYGLGPNGPPAVPTGLVFVRFREEVRIEERRGALEEAGYTVRHILSYAPHAAWVQARFGGIAEALTGIAHLEALPDVVSVEPQLLTERVRR
ncbi:MAG: hypothetical protein ACE5IQ_00065 [Candidatus Methylomirabilales bacterium]